MKVGIIINILYLFIILNSGLETEIKMNIDINFGIKNNDINSETNLR